MRERVKRFVLCDPHTVTAESQSLMGTIEQLLKQRFYMDIELPIWNIVGGSNRILFDHHMDTQDARMDSFLKP